MSDPKDEPDREPEQTVHIRCPTCKKVVVATTLEELPFRPFCSRRCKLVDLGRWLDEDYRISRPLGPDETS